MLTRPDASNGNKYWAQTGWAKWKSSGWEYIGPFVSYTDANGNYWLKYLSPSLTAGSYHYYYTYFTPNSSKTYTFAMDTTTFESHGLGWTPTIVQIYGETHNYNTQMPGDTNSKVRMDQAQYLVVNDATWHAMNTSAGANKPTWYGATKVDSTTYKIWDKYCSSSGG